MPEGYVLCVLPDDLKHVGGDLGEIEVTLILVDKLLKVFFYFTLERELLCCAVLCCAFLQVDLAVLMPFLSHIEFGEFLIENM